MKASLYTEEQFIFETEIIEIRIGDTINNYKIIDIEIIGKLEIKLQGEKICK